MMVFFVVVALLVCGCAASEPPDANYSLPEVLYQPPLPPWPFQTDNASLSITFRIRVGVDGTVNKAIIETPSGSKEWDSLALAQLHKWRYLPAMTNGKPAALWLRQTITIRFEEPLMVPIAEIVCQDPTTADSLYALLLAGAPFDSLARCCSVSDSRVRGGFLGETNVHTFPMHISREMASLRPGEVSKPLRLGRHFVIYKRLANGA